MDGLASPDPSSIGEFSDGGEIPEWAKTDILLAWRNALFPQTYTGRANASEEITRADAAYVIRRLFDRIWL
jgi:hypothetical protein